MSDRINCLLTEPGVNMGDHAQDVTTAIEVSPTESVGDLLRRTLYARPEYHPYLTIRVAVENGRGARHD